ncbi:cytochrome P450 [Amylocarpus encephaloides]|uniref:Cytochrome P450 n=1 Tax=Amylocarpus encephaloides TaxID=45428 RepID=A0A9P7YBX3_9HELO|nr:cytochrome P450 [Amylocarpus encephaloides]
MEVILFERPVVIHYAIIIISFTCVFSFIKIIYRMSWHPLANIPGPKFAAATRLYGAYHDLLTEGSLVRRVAKLHAKYGPVVRISPNEVHVNDLGSYNKIFRVGSDFHKKWDFYNARAIEGSLLNILDTSTARKRKEAYAQYFSRFAVDKIESLIHKHIDIFLSILEDASRSQAPIDLSRAFRCLTADVIVDYSFRQDFEGLKSNNFIHPLIEAGDLMLVYAQWGIYFRKPFLLLDLLINSNPTPEDSEFPTIFDKLLNPAANKGQQVPSDDALAAESILMLLAGTDTTANALVVGVYGTLKNPEIVAMLKRELQEARLGELKEKIGSTLRNLPYLNAIIKESLRLSHGAPGRIPRIVPEGGITIEDMLIPSGTVISHSAYIYHMNEAVFPNAAEFIPERWLGANHRELESNLLSFSRGSRMCLGIHLGMAELQLTFARVFEAFHFTLHETSKSDMEWSDYSVALFKGHLKVMVEEGSPRVQRHF